MKRCRSLAMRWCLVAMATLACAVAFAQGPVDPRYESIVADLLSTPEGLAFLEAFRAIQRDYLGSVDTAALLDAAIRGLVVGVDDPYVRYLDADERAADLRSARDPNVVVAGALGDLGYLRLLSFDSERSGERFAAELDALLARGIRGLVVDLRGNGGGLVLGGLQVLDLFLSDVVLGYRETRFGQIPLGFANPRSVALPLAVLVDEGTASTAEIVAGALQVKGRARLYGAVTAGKGVGQSTLPLSNGGELRLVTFAWSLPDGRSIDGWGLTPDVPVPTGLAEGGSADLFAAVTEPELDPVLAAAVRDLRRLLGDDLGTIPGSLPVDAMPPPAAAR
jgi:C-terminal processing protease CtpA/Prc